MIRLKIFEDLIALTPVKGALESANIECFIKNEFARGAAGKLPIDETLPELWLKDEADKAEAMAIIESFSTASEALADWDCPECHKRIEKEFQLCWQCGHVLAVE